MNHVLRWLLHALYGLNYFGPLVMGFMDSSFLMLPFGNDLVVISLVARHHSGYLWYVLSAVVGSTLGTLLLDLVARKLGETGLQKVTGQRRFEYMKRKIGENGSYAVALACLSPPPFPFTAVVSTVCALGYPRKKLLAIVAISRALRFLLLGYLAMRYGRLIIRVANSSPFRWAMFFFVFVCIAGSVFSLLKWFRRGKARTQEQPAAA